MNRSTPSVNPAASQQYSDAVTRGILESVPGGVVLVRADGAIVTANAEALRVLGLSYDALTKRYTFDWDPETLWEDGNPCPASAYPVSRALATGQPQPGTTLGVRRRDGQVSWAVFRAVPVKDEKDQITGAIVTFLDITERKAAEAERDALEAQLRHAQRLDSIGQLAGGIAHEFNNLLQVILGNLELAASGENIEGQLQDIKGAAERAAELTEGLLAFARRQPVARANVSLGELIDGSRRLLKPLLGDCVLECVSDGAPGVISADAHLIEQALINLCLNARDAMPEGGTIYITTERVRVDAAFAERHAWATASSYLALRVRDTGPGIPSDRHTRIFEPFYTTKPAGAGTGLGLSVVYGVMQSHGGAVTVDSSPGNGATFSLYFPEAAPAPAQPRGEKPVTAPRDGQERILVVEDEDTIRRLVVRLLTARGYDVLSAATGQQALDLVRTLEAPIDLMFVDVVMPGMRGPELVRRARELKPDLRVLFTTGYELKPSDGESRGKDPILYKPYTPDQLLPRVRELLDAPPPSTRLDAPR